MKKTIGFLIKLIELLWRVVDIGDGTEKAVAMAGVKAAKGLRNAIIILFWILGLGISFVLFIYSITDDLFYTYVITSIFGFVVIAVVYLSKNFKKQVHNLLLFIWVMYALYSFALNPIFKHVIGVERVFNIGTLDVAFVFLGICFNILFKVIDIKIKEVKQIFEKLQGDKTFAWITFGLFVVYFVKFSVTSKLLVPTDVIAVIPDTSVITNVKDYFMDLLNVMEIRSTFWITSFGIITLYVKLRAIAKEDKVVEGESNFT